MCYELILLSKLPNVILIADTWLGDTISLPQFLVERYSVFRRDKNRNGGGVMLLVDIMYDAVEIAFNNSIIEAAWYFFCVFKQKCVCSTLYRTNSSNAEYFNSMCEMITNVCNSHPRNPIIISGDFNISNISWEFLYSLRNKKITYEFVKCIQENILTQYVNFPTKKYNLLDLLFCKNLTSLPVIEHASLLINSDHEFVKVILDFPNTPSTGYKTNETANNFKLNFKKADYIKLQIIFFRNLVSNFFIHK